jgi:hypothetical protein
MGYFLLYENMLNSVLIAKDKFLKQGGIMVPGNCWLFLAPYHNDANALMSFRDEYDNVINSCTDELSPQFLMGCQNEIFQIDMNKAL